MKLYMRFTFFWGGSSAVIVNFYRPLELTTPTCHKIGSAPTWHFVDDKGTFDLRESEKTRVCAGDARETCSDTGALMFVCGWPG